MQEVILGQQPVVEVLRADRRRAFRLYLLQSKEEQLEKDPSQTNKLKEILQLCHQRNIPIQKVDRLKLDSLGSNHQGIALFVEPYPYADFADILELISSPSEETKPMFLVLDMIQDPQNLGTLLRTAEAVGVRGVLLPLRRSALVTPAVVHASSGASEHLHICQANLAQAIERMKKLGVWVIGLDSSGDDLLISQLPYQESLAFVVGNEGEGIRPLVRASCDMILRLPMCGNIESLNAAVAGSIVLYLTWLSRLKMV